MAGSNHTESCNSTSIDSSPVANSKKHNRKLDVYNELLIRLKDNEKAKVPGFEEQLWNHFNRLPARYAMDVNVERAEHVLDHKRMLEDVRNPEKKESIVWDVGVVQGPAMSTAVSRNSIMQEVSGYKQSLHPPPMFGSSANLEALDREVNNSSPEDNRSNVNRPSSRPMYEVTFAADDRPKLLNQLTSSLGDLDLNIEEAHAFSTNDGYSLDVFVVDGEKYKDDKMLKDALDKEMQKIKKLFPSKSQPSDSKAPQIQEPISSSLHVQIPIDDCDVWEIDYGHLKFGKHIASGTYGQLYRGTYRSQDVAVKMLKHERMNADMEREFAQEVYIMRKIRHKNVVQFIGACTKPPHLCIVTEFMSRGSVYDFLHKQKGSFKFPALLRAAIDICKGMNYLHQNNIIHRDLKAANLLMDENQVIKVADFGVARVKSRSGVMTAETGTYRWMAPEVIEHKPYDHKADVFSFGIVLWELLTREIPYEQYTPLQAAVGVVQKGLRPVIPKHTPPKYASLLESCWQQDPKERPDFSEILKILESIFKEVKDEPEKSSGGFLYGFRGH